MKKDRMVALREPHNYWINRRVWISDGTEYVGINGFMFELDSLILTGWEVRYLYD